MPRSKEPINPFYVLLVVAGILFSVTACAYAMMTFRSIRGEDLTQSTSALMHFLERRGGALLAGELAVLGVATLAAIALDASRKERSQSLVRRNETSVSKELDNSGE